MEYAFQKQGRPNGYILGQDAGGAFVAGLRYGEGILYTKDAGSHRVYWQGPSIGYDAGAEGSKVLMLVYNLRDPEEIYQRFGGVDGSAYLVGGVGVTFQKNEHVVIAPNGGIVDNGVAYGVILDGFKPKSSDLDSATRELIASMQQGNPGMKQIGNEEEITVNGVHARSVDVTNTSTVPTSMLVMARKVRALLLRRDETTAARLAARRLRSSRRRT